MEQLENSVPQELYQQIEQQLEDMQSTITTLTAQVEQLQSENSSLRSENEELRERIRQYENIEQEYEAALQRIQELEEQIEDMPETNNAEISGGMVFGTNAEVGVVCIWPENVDVDLYVKNLQTGEICNFRNKNWAWGNLLEDVRTRREGDDRYELFYQREIVPGEYQIYVNIYSDPRAPWNGTPATVSGYVVMHPGKRNQKKIDFRTIRLTQPMQNTDFGVLRVTNDNIYFQ